MKNYRSLEMIDAYNSGGARERYAMENGNKRIIYLNGHKCFKFTYSRRYVYQDGNGCIYDTVLKRWIN